MAEKPPDLLTLGTWEALQVLQQEALQGALRLRSLHEEYFRSYREQLRREFLGRFVLKPSEDGQPSTQVWDALLAKRDDVPARLSALFAQTLAAAAEEDSALLEEDLDNALVEGHNRELWLLAMGGLPAWEYDALPEEGTRADLLLAAGLAGIGWQARLRRWQGVTQERGQRWLRASILGGRSLDETEQGLDAAARHYDTRIVGLYENELWRAYGLGATLALEAVAADHEIVEIWVTREDLLVCPICEALHLEVTDKQPVTDSHPGCRCRKVPVPADFSPTPISYPELLGRLGSA